MNLFTAAGLSVVISSVCLAAIALIFGKSVIHRLLFCFSIACAIWGGGTVLVGISDSGNEALLGWKVAHVGGIFIGPLFYHLTSAFTRSSNRRLLAFAYAQAALFVFLGVGSPYMFRETHVAFGLNYLSWSPLYITGVSFYFLFTILGYFYLVRFSRSVQGIERLQTSFIIYGTLIGFSGASSTFLPIFGLDILYPFGNLGITLYCIVLGIAIFRYRLMDIEVIIRKSLAASIAAGLLTGLFIFLVLILSTLFSAHTDKPSFTVTLLAALLISFLYGPLNMRIRGYLDSIFKVSAYDYAVTVKNISEGLSSLELQKLITLIVDTLFDSLKLTWTCLFHLRQDTFRQVYERHAGGDSSGDICSMPLSPASPLYAFLQEGNICARDNIPDMKNSPEMQAVLEELRLRHAAAAVPIFVGGSLDIILMLGEKQSGDTFTKEDITLLATVANQTSIAMKNAQLYQERKERATELEIINARLTEEIAEKNKVMDLLAQSKSDWVESFNTINDAITIHTRDFDIIRGNSAANDIRVLSVYPVMKIKCLTAFHNPPVGGASASGRPDSDNFIIEEIYEPQIKKHFEAKAIARYDRQRNITGFILIVRDVTESKKLKEQLLQSQKMEAIGRLAGGVAHDFNNILSAIVGYGNLALLKTGNDRKLQDYVDQILVAADRGASLTQSLLAFSRQQITNPKPENINVIVKNQEKFLQRLIREDIVIEMTLAPEDLTILADRGQIEQVLMNLVTNARDAMPSGGRILLRTAAVVMGPDYIEERGYGKVGNYALLSVTDTGEGMDDDIRRRMFEPFFTTKEQGKGTGLGLSIVYGIVKQHNGFIDVHSRKGNGTSVKMYLPITGGSVETRKTITDHEAMKGGTETVLIAEDDVQLRRLASTILSNHGYTVIEAEDGEDGLKQYIDHIGKIDVVVLDVIMPRKNGKELCEEIKLITPSIKTLFMSGYTEDVISERGLLDPDITVLHKPFSPSDLLKKVRFVLDA